MERVISVWFCVFCLRVSSHTKLYTNVTEPRGGGRGRPESGCHSQQDLRRGPERRRAAGGRPGQITAEQRSQGDPDGGQAAQRRQIIGLG